MTEEEKQQLCNFESRLRHLIFLHDELKKENVELKQQLKSEIEKNQKLKVENDKLNVDYTNIKTAATISINDSDVKETKLRLSKLVCDVDKCISMLNE